MASLTGNLVAETYKALLKTIDNDILTASEKQITDGLGGGSNVFIDSQGFLRANKYKVTNGLATQFLKADGSLDANTYAIDSNTVHLTGNETIYGFKTFATGANIQQLQIKEGAGFSQVLGYSQIAASGSYFHFNNGANTAYARFLYGTGQRTYTLPSTDGTIALISDIPSSTATWGAITGTLSNQTDLQNALNAKYNNPSGTISQYIRGDGSLATFPAIAGFVPYTGATANVDLGEFALSAEYLAIDTDTTHSTDVGEIVWNAIDGTFDMGLLNDVVLQAGQELHFYGKATGAIGNGKAVMFAGVEGDHLLMSLADAATINANPQYFIGVATQDFANNDFGYVTILGKVRNLNTTAYTLGSILYFDSTSATDGLLTTTEPPAPNAKIEVAAVIRVHGTQGTLMVRPHTMPRMKDIQDVNISSISNNQVLAWATNRFENKSIATILGYTPANDAQVVHNTGDETVNGRKTFTTQQTFNNSFLIKNTGSGSVPYGGWTTIYTSDDSFNILVGTSASTSKLVSFLYGSTNPQLTLPSADGTLALVSQLSNFVSGSGSTGYIPKWTSSSVIGSSLLYDDGTNIGYGTNVLNYGNYGRTFTGAGFGTASFGFESVSNSITNNALLGGLSFVIGTNDSSRRIGSAIQAYLLASTATNYGAELRFYAKADAGVLGEVARMTSAGLRVYGTIVKDGGTSGQFLKADGSIDSNAYLPLTGGTMSGILANSSFIISLSQFVVQKNSSGTSAAFYGFQNSSGTNRWNISIDNTETGSGNSGFDFNIYRYSDVGATLSSALTILRSSGNVGIGTNNPLWKLSVINDMVVGAQGGSDYTYISGGSGYGAKVKLFYANGSLNSELSGNGNTILNVVTGNVGIGNGASYAPYLLTLNVSGGGQTFGGIDNNNGASLGYIQFNVGSMLLNARGNGDTNYMQFNTGGSERVRIANNGYVGINTSAYSLVNTFQLGRVFGFVQDINSGYIQANMANSGNYIVSQYAVRIHLDSAIGEINFLTAGSGTAGNSVTLNNRLKIANNGDIQTNGNPVYAHSGSLTIGGSYQTIFTAVSGAIYLVSAVTTAADGTFGLLTVINDPDKSLGMIYGNNILLQFSGDNVQMKSSNGASYNTSWTATRLK